MADQSSLPRLPQPSGDVTANPRLVTVEGFILQFKADSQVLSDLDGDEMSFIDPTDPDDEAPILRQKIRDALVRAEGEMLGRMGLDHDSVPDVIKPVIVQCVYDIARYRLDFLTARKDGKERCDKCYEFAQTYTTPGRSSLSSGVAGGMSAFAL